MSDRRLCPVRVLFIFAALWLVAGAAAAADWQRVPVPGPWPAAPADADGFAWYRTWVKVHDSFFTKHERNLFEESVGVNLRDLAGAHEVWVNGKKIGTGGAFPPAYRSGRATFHRHKVPVGTLRPGAWNEIAIRVHVPRGEPGGFLGEAPFIMNYFMECVLEGEWEFRRGNDYTPGGPLETRPATSAFDKFRESNRVLGRAQQVPGARLSPAESAAKLAPAPGFAVDLILHEPEIAQPFYFSFDERGRLWVTESRQYPYPAGVTMLSRDKYYRAHYDKVPPAPPHHDRGADRVTIHASTKGDGVYDSHKTFLDGLNLANAALRGRGGVWVMHTPYLLFYPDRDGDDVPDGDPEVRLAGFGFEDTHSVANGLVWGPDGWLYGGQGSTTSSRVTRPGIDPADSPGVHFEGCMVWRYHPETRAYEIFAEGSGNTFGLEFDAQGRLYSGHNGGNTRGWHYVQGGFYLMQGVDPGKFGPPRNPYAFGDLPMLSTADRIVRFTHFGAFAEGTALPDVQAGRLFALDPLHNVVLTSEWQPRGSTFATADRGAALQSADPAFRPVYIANAPDGSLYVSDMYEFYIAHGQHYQNQIDPSTGRMYRLRGSDTRLETDLNLAAKTTDQLIALLGHPNKWHRQTAVRLLGERHDAAAAPKLRARIAQERGLAALNALWALHQSAGLDVPTALVALRHADAAVRTWTTRFLGDEWGLQRNLGAGRHARVAAGVLPARLFDALVAQARAETDPEALVQFAATARRLAPAQALPLVAAVLEHAEAARDAYLPLMCWWVFEAHIPAANREVLAFFSAPERWEMPLVFEHLLPRIARRYAVEGRRQEVALRTLLEDLGARAFTTNFEDLGDLRQLPGLAVQRLMAQGYGFGAEGDWKTAVLVRAAKVMGEGLAGGASLMEDYTYDLTPGDELILGAHMLEICPSLTTSTPRVEIHPLGIGGKDDPVRMVFDADPGEGVVVSLADMRDRFRLTANVVDVVAPPAPLPHLPVARAVWRPRPDFGTSAECWLTAGGAHHTVMSTAAGVDAFEIFADLAGAELLVIDEHTTRRGFRDSVRWNAAYHRLAAGL